MTSLVSSCQKWLLTQSTWRGNDSDKGPQINSISKRVVFILSRGLSFLEEEMGMSLIYSIYFASKLTCLLETNPCIAVSYQNGTPCKNANIALPFHILESLSRV